MPDVDILLTTTELAERLNVSPSTIRKWVKRGLIPEIVISPNVRRFEFTAVLNAFREGLLKGGNNVQ